MECSIRQVEIVHINLLTASRVYRAEGKSNSRANIISSGRDTTYFFEEKTELLVLEISPLNWIAHRL